MTNPYIEKLARSAYEAERPAADLMRLQHDWDSDVGRQEAYRATVRAILTAMREPTEAMLYAGFRQNRFRNPITCGKAGCLGAVTLPPDKVWTAMIDAALAEEPATEKVG